MTSRFRLVLAAFLTVLVTVLVPTAIAQAYRPTGGIVYQLTDADQCLKGRGNCAVYPKSTELPSGRLVAAFEKATVNPVSGAATGGTLPVYKSDDDGTTWQSLSTVRPPAELSSDPAYAKYTSNWGSPYLYVMPQTVGNVAAGTLLVASLVTGEDYYYTEHKAADPSWTPTNDGDRKDLAIALFASTDEGVTWDVVNIIATGGWQGGSAGAIGTNVAAANTYRQVDPVWEPFLIVRDGKLVTYYSDENDYLGYNSTTGVATLDPANDTATDSHGQILAHRTWDGTSAAWSAPVVDVAGTTVNVGGKSLIGGGRPGMTTIAPTSDGKWLLTFEYWGGGTNTRFKTATDPLRFFADGDVDGTGVDTLGVSGGSRRLATGGSPVLIPLPDGRIAYNASGSGNIWVSRSGLAAGPWTEYQTTVGAGYSRALQYVTGTGRVVILQGTWGGATSNAIIRYGEVDLGRSAGTYYQLVNRKTGQVIGTGNHSNDANIGNGDVPDVVLEEAGSVADGDTQFWHVTTKAGGAVTLLNKSGGRAAGIWTGTASAGQRIGQWVDNTESGLWNLVTTGDGYTRLQAAASTGLYLTGATAGAPLTLQTAATDGSQDWTLVEQRPERLVNRNSGKCLDVNAFSTADGGRVQQWTCGAGTNQQWQVQAVAGGYVQITGVNSGKCLDVNASSTANGGTVQQWTCNGGTNQQWRVQDVSGGYVQVVNRNSGKCLDVDAFSTANGGTVQQWTCTGGTNQAWQRASL
ncbi:ricin-type beta-trefoil lectin protein [Promicromonospora sp. AC04]|uniref:RICIN domain-containing protein n=1 Tax=Promicromonospora sp. AC04 TaxID=2135723 RepID=UPI000D3A0DE0|nr:RICIN domain-containing protein [Promicromonospora sp. AC04]PUB24802.1 ricin-type beta-trefoil lectin protein [Promicromonospora sp. AC04]